MNNIFDYIKWIWGIDYALPGTDSVLYRDLQFNKTGIVSVGDEMLFGTIENAGAVGPVFTAPPDRETITRILHLLNVNIAEYEKYSTVLTEAPIMSVNEFAKIICMAHFVIHKTELQPEALFPDLSHDDMQEEYVPPMRNYQIEQLLLPLIRKGDVQTINLLLTSANYKTVYKFGNSNLSSMKKIAVSLITLASREAIKGGADVDRALSKSDEFLGKIDGISRIDGVFKLLYQAVIAFARLAGSEEAYNDLSLVTLKVVKYINRNIDKKIKLCNLAEHTGVTPNYLSSLFKKETGKTVADYIKAQKLNEAKRLLSETDLSLSEIADSLAFSSQSYFQNCFKAQFGITPAQYKNDITR